MVLSLAAFSLAGCGLVQQTAASALGPIFTMASNTAANAGNDIQVVTSSISTGASTLGQTVGSTYTAVSQTAANATPLAQSIAAAPQQMAAISQAQQMGTSQGGSSSKPADPKLDILPAETLKKLSKDQASLQHLVQSIAFNAPAGQPAYWYYQGASGTAVADSEDYLGFFLCRTFVQTVTLDGKTVKAEKIACHDHGGGWSEPF